MINNIFQKLDLDNKTKESNYMYRMFQICKYVHSVARLYFSFPFFLSGI